MPTRRIGSHQTISFSTTRMGETVEDRRRGIRAVRSKDTKPEMRVRRVVHAAGYRYRLHRSDLPGTPDLVFASRRKVVFVNGCMWHGHECKNGSRVPKTNDAYWQPKIARNIKRDAENLKKLAELGWATLTVWECETTNASKSLAERLTRFLG